MTLCHCCRLSAYYTWNQDRAQSGARLRCWTSRASSIYPGVVNQAANTVSGSHVYAEAGVYTVKLTVTDAFPVSGELVSEYVVVSNLEAAL